MKIWFPYVVGRSGADVHTEVLAGTLGSRGHETVLTKFPIWTQLAPDLLRGFYPPADMDVIVTNSRTGFAFSRSSVPLVTIEHLYVHGEELHGHRSFHQALFYDLLLRRYVRRSYETAVRIVAPSEHTWALIQQFEPRFSADVIRHGVDTTFFSPSVRLPTEHRPFRLLFVGNLSVRKGADLLAPMLELLGDGYELRYTSGMKTRQLLAADNCVPLGNLDRDQVRDEYQSADMLICPTRLESGPLVAMEAMACGLPVIGSDQASMPEVVVDGETGLLCSLDPRELAQGVRTLALDPQLRLQMSRAARQRAVAHFDVERMVDDYLVLFEEILAAAHQ